VLRRWAAHGAWHDVLGHSLFVADLAPHGPARHEPLLVVHGFPTSSLDFHLVADELRQGRRVILPDLLGYGLSDKPDRAYTMDLHADLLVALSAQLGLVEVSLLTHDVGDTIGGELLARQAEGRWPITVVRRVVTNGSVYIESAHLSAGQQLLLTLPDRSFDPEGMVDRDTMTASLRATHGPGAAVSDDEFEAAWEAMALLDGPRLLARHIRYVEERRRRQDRFTGAIEVHPSPLHIVWGADDPIAVRPMADRLQRSVPGASLVVLDGIGHYPMLECPERFAAAVAPGLH
jgi:pimeloyl-ACP methyl ester carboxylesterase